MSECAQCGRQLTASETGEVCDLCRQRRFAIDAEDSATAESQLHFVVTNLLLAINVAVFVLMVLKRVPVWHPSSEPIIRWGGNFGPLTMGTQPWRLITNVFVHIGLFHIIANMWALFVVGRLAESLYGRISFLAIYLISGISGSLASLFWNPMGVSAGASGALFGVVGALIATLFAGKLPLPKHVVRPVLWSLLFWAAFNLFYGFQKTGVDNAAHVGGVLAGLVLGFPLGHHLGTDSQATRSRERIFTFGLIGLAVVSFFVWRFESYVVQVEQARLVLAQNKPDQAITLLQPALRKRPNEALVHMLLAQAYTEKMDFASAERELKVATSLAPNNGTIWRSLGDLYIARQRWEDAANAFTKAAAIGKDNGLSWFQAGIAYRQLDRSQNAADAFRKCVGVNPYFGEAWFQLGISLLNLKQNQNAISALQQATKLMPNNPDAHLWLGNALLSVGQEEASKSEFVKAFQLRSAQLRAIQELKKQQQQRQSQSVQPAQPAPAK